MKFAFVAAEKAWAPVALLCRILEVSRSGFYVWEARGPSPRKRNDEKLSVRIAAIHEASGERYGSPRVHAELAAEGVLVQRERDFGLTPYRERGRWLGAT